VILENPRGKLDFAPDRKDATRMFCSPRLVLSLLFCASAIAAEPAKIEPKAEELIRKITAPFQAAKSAEVDLKVIVELPDKKESAASYALAVTKPNRIALVMNEGVIGASIFSDGTNTTTFVPMLNRYVVGPAPKQIADIVLGAGEAFGDATGSMAFIAALFSPKPYDALVAGVSEATYGGLEIFEGAQLQRVNFKQEGLGWSLLMTTNSSASLRRIEVDVSKLPVDAAKMTMQFANWKFDPAIAPERFHFTPPKEAQKVDAFFSGDSDLIGEKLPAFKLRGIDDTKWDSSDWKGHTTVLLFWAGQEEHCVKALAAVSELAAANKAVKFYAINLDETGAKEKVLELYAKNKISLPTALDPAHAVADELQVDGVPMTFLIDKEGVIRNAWLGHHPDYKQIIAKELK
jgi:peroxiredoxin